ncbi:MAG: hypothetical protein LBT29_00220 [Flavobacteriaceae bacterium]|jgi:hypothetical protein|nr:hypothetical protein [Flavobacteriaceae bacterium]
MALINCKKLGTIIVLSLFMIGCLVPPAPHTDYYKPVYNNNVNLIAIKKEYPDRIYSNYYYLIKLTDSFTIKTRLQVGSLPKSKGWTLLVESTENIDSMKLESTRLHMLEYLNIHYDSIFRKNYFINDRKWYGNFIKRRDTMLLHIYKSNKEYIVPYYLNAKHGMETYPFSKISNENR